MPSCKYPISILSPHLEAENAPMSEGFSPRAPLSHQRNACRLSDALSCDDFRMYDYKVRRCMRAKSHDWTNCPFAHQGEKARRRDPRKIHYSGVPCPDFRKGGCRRGDFCVYAHGVFECWLHPTRYRTQPCRDGKDCKRKVCFFAHSKQQLRHVAASVDKSHVDGASIMDFHTQEPYSYVQEVGLPVSRGSMEDLFKEEGSEMSSYEQYEVTMAMPTNTPASSSGDLYNLHLGSSSATFSILTWSSPTQHLSSSPYEPVSSIGFSLNHPPSVPLEVLPPLNPFTVPPRRLPSSGSLSQQAAPRQEFLMPECYGEGGKVRESNFFVSSDEVSDMVHYRGYGGTTHDFMIAPRRGGSDVDEVSNGLSETSELICSTDQLVVLGKDLSSYKSWGSYGLSSPTSTLEGPFNVSSFSSSPLSPSNTPISNTSNVISSRGHGSIAQVGDRLPKADTCILNRQCGKKLESKHISTDQEFLNTNHHSQLVGYGAFPQCLELPSFSQCTSLQNKWNSLYGHRKAVGSDKRDILPDSTWQKVCDKFGTDGASESAIPDLGWVCELVR